MRFDRSIRAASVSRPVSERGFCFVFDRVFVIAVPLPASGSSTPEESCRGLSTRGSHARLNAIDATRNRLILPIRTAASWNSEKLAFADSAPPA